MARELRHCCACFDAPLVRTPQAADNIRIDHGHAFAQRSGVHELAVFSHLAAREFFEHRHGFGRACEHGSCAMQDRDARGGRDLVPDFARTPCAAPGVAGGLAGYGDVTEVADRSTVGLRVPIDDDDALARARGGEGVGEADDAGADHCEVEWLAGNQRGAGACRGTDRNTPNSAAMLQLTRAWTLPCSS